MYNDPHHDLMLFVASQESSRHEFRSHRGGPYGIVLVGFCRPLLATIGIRFTWLAHIDLAEIIARLHPTPLLRRRLLRPLVQDRSSNVCAYDYWRARMAQTGRSREGGSGYV